MNSASAQPFSVLNACILGGSGYGFTGPDWRQEKEKDPIWEDLLKGAADRATVGKEGDSSHWRDIGGEQMANKHH